MATPKELREIIQASVAEELGLGSLHFPKVEDIPHAASLGLGIGEETIMDDEGRIYYAGQPLGSRPRAGKVGVYPLYAGGMSLNRLTVDRISENILRKLLNENIVGAEAPPAEPHDMTGTQRRADQPGEQAARSQNETAEIDVIAEMRAMGEAMDDALTIAEVSVEDAKLFLKSRGIDA